MSELVLQVYGDPASAGSKTPVMTGAGMRVVDGATKAARAHRAAWRQDVVAAARAAMGDGYKALEGPVALVVCLHMPRPLNTPQKRRDGTIPLPTKRPDLTKLIRSTEDGLTAAGVWRDDSQVVYLAVEKKYATPERPPGADIIVRSIT